MEWLRKNKTNFISLTVTSFLIFCAELFYLRSLSGPQEFERWELGLFITPAVISFAGLAPLIYLAWFGNAQQGPFNKVMKLVYWLFIAAFVGIIVSLFTIFVF